MYFRRFASAFGAGSVAITSKPRARNSAAQLAPITPVPTMAIRRTGLSKAIFVFSLPASERRVAQLLLLDNRRILVVLAGSCTRNVVDESSFANPNGHTSSHRGAYSFDRLNGF